MFLLSPNCAYDLIASIKRTVMLCDIFGVCSICSVDIILISVVNFVLKC